MHELSVCNALIEQVEKIARREHASAVARITLRIGPLSGIEWELLRNAFPLAAAGTLADQAELVIETAKVTVQCSQCGAASEVPANRLLCAGCGDFRTRIISGDELILQRVELTMPRRHHGDEALEQAASRR